MSRIHAATCALALLSFVLTQTLDAQSKPSVQLYRPTQHPIATALSPAGAGPIRQGAGPALLVVDSADVDGALQSGAVNRALASGSWVVVLNASETQKRERLFAQTGTGTSGGSAAYMVRLIPTGKGRTAVHVADLRSVSIPDAGASSGFGAASTAEYAHQINTFAADDTVAAKAKAFAAGIPDGLLYKDYYFSSEAVVGLGSSKYEGGSQQTRLTMLTHVTIFLDNRRNPQGDFQWIACTIDGQANPTDGGSRATDKEREKAWMQSLINVSIVPVSAPTLQWVATAPANPNPDATYTTNASFQVGFSTSNGPSGTYTWGSSNSYTISDWGVASTSSGLNGNWGFGSQKPGNGFYRGNLTDCDAGWSRTCFFQSGLPNTPNNQVWTPVQFHTEEVWKTTAAVDQTMSVAANASQTLLDVYCGYYSPGACWGDEGWTSRYAYAGGYNLINLGAVIPVPIQSLTFDKNPVNGGQDVTATVTLTKPAPTDVEVDIASNSQNAVVLPTVTIKQGATSASFVIHTNTNGIQPHGSTVAAITAFYAQNFVKQLTIQRP